MSTYTVRPTSVITKGGTTSPSAQATVLTNMGDNSDTTNVQNNAATAITWIFGLGAASVASDEFVCRVGISNRWAQTAGSSKTLAGAIYRATDSKPGGYPAFSTYIQATPVTTEFSYQNVSWSRTEVDTLRYLWWDGSTTSTLANCPKTYDIWGTVYTLKNATCAPLAQTWSTSTTPTVTVPVTATIGWEAATQEWQKLRTITIEVRIESGGTGVGTGTLMSTTTQDTVWLTSGTASSTITMPNSLTNGTYNLYARAIRHRESETSVASDQYGSWSTGVVLTMSVTPPTAPTVTATADQVNDRVAVAVTPIAGNSYTNPAIDVEKSYDGGTTWTALRNGTGLSGTFGSATTVYDYEAPRGSAAMYRARVYAYLGSTVNTSVNSSTASATVNAIDWNLKCPESSTLNMLNVQVIGNPTENLVEDMGVFRALDRQYPVVVSGTLSGWDGDLTIQCSTSAEWTSLKALLQSQKVLLLESPFGWSKYVRAVDGASASIAGTATTPRRTVTLNYVQTDAP